MAKRNVTDTAQHNLCTCHANSGSHAQKAISALLGLTQRSIAIRPDALQTYSVIIYYSQMKLGRGQRDTGNIDINSSRRLSSRRLVLRTRLVSPAFLNCVILVYLIYLPFRPGRSDLPRYATFASPSCSLISNCSQHVHMDRWLV